MGIILLYEARMRFTIISEFLLLLGSESKVVHEYWIFERKSEKDCSLFVWEVSIYKVTDYLR